MFFIIYYLLYLLQGFFIKCLIFLPPSALRATPPQAGNFDRNKNELTNLIPEHCHCERSVAIQVYNMCSALPNYFFIYLDTHADYSSAQYDTTALCLSPFRLRRTSPLGQNQPAPSAPRKMLRRDFGRRTKIKTEIDNKSYNKKTAKKAVLISVLISFWI